MASTTASPNPPNEYLDFGQSTNSVLVGNIPNHLDIRDIVTLFRTLIGEIHSVRDMKEKRPGQLEIAFHNRDAATKALCMNGYAIGGATLHVSPVVRSPSRPKQQTDHRRNLYVLGLPFALSKSEFPAYFAPFGTVTHSVILATVDNSSRRRGFVVMSTHEEAKRALTALTRSQIKGHTIDVSWAVVQRSQGFLDGGDRSMLLDPRSSHLPSPGHHDRLGYSSSSASDSSDFSPVLSNSDPGSIINSPLPTTTLFVTNLPALLFSQVQDLHPLLCPFGRIERIQTVQIPNSETISAVVQYGSPETAMEARISLNGQRYNSLQVEAHFVHPSFGDCNRDFNSNFPFAANSLDSIASLRSPRTATPLLGLNSFNSDGMAHHLGEYSPDGPPASARGANPQTYVLKERNDGRSGSTCSRWRTESPKNHVYGQMPPLRRMHFNPNAAYPSFSA